MNVGTSAQLAEKGLPKHSENKYFTERRLLEGLERFQVDVASQWLVSPMRLYNHNQPCQPNCGGAFPFPNQLEI